MKKILKLVPQQECEALAALIRKAWHSAYDGLLGEAQVDYMTGKFQSASAIRTQIKGGKAIYFYILSAEEKAGYCVLEAEEEKLFLSKLYLFPGFCGKGLGKKALDTIADIAKQLGLRAVYLTVNKRNARAMAVYEKFGFRRTDSIVTDIGEGYVMDDYVYEYTV